MRNGAVAKLIELPVPERPRERALREGLHRLQDCELVALVLRTGTGKRDAVALARALLTRFGGVQGLLCQDANALLRETGLGAAKVAALLAIPELVKRAELTEATARPYIDGAAAARRYLGLEIGNLEREVFGVILLTSRHRVLAFEKLFFGTVDRTTVHTRELVKCCMRHNAAAAILFHNHPSGNPNPSPGDVELTERLRNVLDEVDVRLLDHLVFAKAKHVSFAEHGLLKSDYHIKDDD